MTVSIAASCGGGQPGVDSLVSPQAVPAGAEAAAPVETGWPAGLPVDRVEPWEAVDANGYVIAPTVGGRGVSGINADSEFTPGVERYAEAGSIADYGEASTLTSGAADSAALSWATYRIPLGGDQPGTVSADVNLRARSDGSASAYWLGLSDYAAGSWEWHGPFSDNHVRISVPAGNYVSGLGNLFATVVAYDGADFDVVGVGVNPRDVMDTTAPPVPSAPVVTPVAGGLQVEWLPVIAADLAGYKVYYRHDPFTESPTIDVPRVEYIEGGTFHLLSGVGESQFVRVSAVDLSGNESLASPEASGAPLTGTAPVLTLATDAVSGLIGATISLTASGADTYDFDLDGDGSYEITGDLTGMATADTGQTGIIRPRVRGTSGTAIALSAVSLLVSGNSRPAANAYAFPSNGIAPLDVTLSANAWDFDGTITEYWWDINGNSGWDYQFVSPDGPNPPVQTYTEPGTYNVKLRVYDDQGAWDVDTVTVTVKRSGQWEQSLPDFSSGSGYWPSVAIVDGNPAIAYHHTGTGFLVYVRALDEYGTAWGTPSAIVAVGGAGQYCDLEVIAGNPAVAYFHAGLGEVQYIRADDAQGTSWTKPPVMLEIIPSFEDVSLAYVDGNPAVAYWAIGDLHYVRADSAAGTGDTPADWGSPPVVVDPTGTVGGYTSLAVINGNPAIGYWDSFTAGARYIRAVNTTGQTGADWPGASVLVSGATNVGGYITLLNVNGNAAMSYFENGVGSLQFIRALTPNGANAGEWPAASNTVDTGGVVGQYASMALINGRAAISYMVSAPFPALCFSQATDLNGLSWTPRELAHFDPSWAGGEWCDLINNQGQPFIAHHSIGYNMVQCTFIPAH